MLFVCQFNLTAAPILPPLLSDLALLTFFVDSKVGELNRENGHDWQLRAYRSLENLAQLGAPGEAPALKRGFECRWEENSERPSALTKVGGHPTTIQSEPWWYYVDDAAQPKYCLQINSEEKVGLCWGEAGMVYLARGTAAD